MWTIVKVFIEFVTILLLFCVLVLVFWPRGMWDVSSSTRDGTHTPCTGSKVLTTQLPGSPRSGPINTRQSRFTIGEYYRDKEDDLYI